MTYWRTTLFETKQRSYYGCVFTSIQGQNKGQLGTSIEAKQHNNDSSSRCLTISWARMNPKQSTIRPVYWIIAKPDTCYGFQPVLNVRTIENARLKYQNGWPLDLPHPVPIVGFGSGATSSCRPMVEGRLPPATTATPDINTTDSNSKSTMNSRKHDKHSRHSHRNDY